MGRKSPRVRGGPDTDNMQHRAAPHRKSHGLNSHDVVMFLIAAVGFVLCVVLVVLINWLSKPEPPSLGPPEMPSPSRSLP